MNDLDALAVAIWMLRQPLIGASPEMRWAALDEDERSKARAYARFVESLVNDLRDEQ